MKLFKPSTTIEFNECNTEPSIITPLGTVNLSLYYGDLDILLEKPNFNKVLPSGGRIYGWEARNIIVETVISNPPIYIPETMKIDSAVGILIRILCETDNISLRFLTYWSQRCWEDGGSDTGQYLEASTWDKDCRRLSIGAEDSEYMVQRMNGNKLMPIRLRDSYDLVMSNEEGLTIELPSIRVNELCQFHVYIAWNSISNKYDASTWYAVDQSSEQILSFEALL